jgi:hypothetical protein
VKEDKIEEKRNEYRCIEGKAEKTTMKIIILKRILER